MKNKFIRARKASVYTQNEIRQRMEAKLPLNIKKLRRKAVGLRAKKWTIKADWRNYHQVLSRQRVAELQRQGRLRRAE